MVCILCCAFCVVSSSVFVIFFTYLFIFYSSSKRTDLIFDSLHRMLCDLLFKIFVAFLYCYMFAFVRISAQQQALMYFFRPPGTLVPGFAAGVI